MNSKLLVLLISCILLQSCTTATPENYFDRTTLNLNKYVRLGTMDFKSMQQSKAGNTLYVIKGDTFEPTDSYEAHIQTFLIPEINEDLEKIKDLPVTAETEDLIKASLATFTFVRDCYTNDYIAIAKLMDANAEEKQIEESLATFEKERIPKFQELSEQVMAIALPYAKKNGIPVRQY